MNLTPVSFRGTNINDTTNYNSKFTRQAPLPGANINFVDKGPDQAGAITGKSMADFYWEMTITLNGTVSTQYDTLKALFDTRLYSLYPLICTDGTNQWTINASVAKVGPLTNRLMKITFGLDDVWKTVNTTTESTWAITASGQTNAVTINKGNLDAYPIIEITPTSAKSGITQPFKRFVTIYNVKNWAFTNYPIELTGGGLNTAALISDNSNKCLLNGAINDSVTTIDYDTVTGTMPNAGILYIDTEQISYTGKTATQFTGCTRGVGGTTPASHLDNAVIYKSHLLVNGNDWRVYVDGIEIYRWLDGLNTATTKCWSNITLAKKQEFTLKTSIASSGSITSIDVNEDISNMPDEGILLIDSEIFTYTSNNDNSLKFTGTITRAAKETSMGAHSVGATVRWIQHEIYIYMGDPTIATPITDDNYKPMINLNTSTNTSWDYDEFFSADPRTGEWTGTPDPLAGQFLYTADQLTYADPASEIGLIGGRVSNLGAAVYAWWQMSHPAGITNWNFANGQKYNLQASSVSFAALQYNTRNTFTAPPANLWVTGYTIPVTTLANTWQSWSDSRSISGGTAFYHIRMAIFTQRKTTRVEAADVTLTLASAGVPSVAMSSEVATGYTFQNAVLKNDTTGESITINQAILLGETIQINTLTKKVRYLKDNSSIFPAIRKTDTSPTRSQWLRLQQGANTLSYTESGAAGLNIVVKWQGRNN